MKNSTRQVLRRSQTQTSKAALTPKAINIREISPDLYLAVKIAAAKRGLTLKAYVLEVLSDRIAAEVKVEKRAGREK